MKVEDEEYKIALADLTGRTLTWDLGAIGILEPGYTYEVDIVVWPNQAAYDYVAGLNNHLRGYTWNESVESDPDHLYTVTVDGTTYEYYTGGVSDHPSIVKDKATGVYSVRTNTEQQLDYSIVTSETNEVTGETTTTSVPQDPITLEPQKPMDLLKTDSYIEKKWNVERDPDILKELLFNQRDAENRWKPYSITFAVYRDLADGVDPEDEEHSNPESLSYIQPYTSVTLGWNGTTYEWLDKEEDLEYVDVNGTSYPLGTRWGKDFSIATGLMLSEEQMDARELDKGKYPWGTYDGVKYWILETGHEYTLVESPKMGYEFDFIAPKYHPMLVDGVLRTVNFTISGKSASISNPKSRVISTQNIRRQEPRVYPETACHVL